MDSISRRTLVVGLSGTPLTAQAEASDPVLTSCALYQALATEQDDLMRRWDELETWLAEHHDWYALTEAARRQLPEAQALYAMDERYEHCLGESAKLMRRLRRMPAHTLEGAIAKLLVVAEDLDAEDCPSAHGLLRSAIADLRKLAPARR